MTNKTSSVSTASLYSNNSTNVNSQMQANSSNNSNNKISSSECGPQPVLTAEELLPKTTVNSTSWSNSAPPVNGINNMNFLNASSQLQSINTVGSSLRNANLQLRSEPPNPQTKVSPWGNSTIEPDLVTRPFEIGCACPESDGLYYKY